MNPALKIGWRYFRGKKSAQAINIISWISIGAIAVSSAAMIVLFSVFNGLEQTVKGMYTAFYPDIKVSAAKGKFFTLGGEKEAAISRISGISVISSTLEDMVLLQANAEQKVATLKGVDQLWFSVSSLQRYMLEGNAGWQPQQSYTPAIMGLGIAAAMGIDVENVFSSLRIYYPGGGKYQAMNPEAALNHIVVRPEGVFQMQDEFDGQYVLTTLEAARHLLQAEGKISALEIKLAPGADERKVRKSLEGLLGPELRVDNRFEQNKTFYLIMRSEKWAVYAILLMVLLIASFNMIGSLSMVVMEKKKDIAILKSMGARRGTIAAVFLVEGGLLALTGGIAGILAGWLLCLGQQYFGWISLPTGFIISAYPVDMQTADFLLVLVTALAVGLLAAWYPALKAARQPVYLREE